MKINIFALCFLLGASLIVLLNALISSANNVNMVPVNELLSTNDILRYNLTFTPKAYSQLEELNYSTDREQGLCITATVENGTIYVESFDKSLEIIATDNSLSARFDLCNNGFLHTHGSTTSLPSTQDYFAFGNYYALNSRETIFLIINNAKEISSVVIVNQTAQTTIAREQYHQF